MFLKKIAADYSYKNPDEWVKMNPTCGGSKQSPIDLGESVSKILDVDCPTAVFSHYFDKPNSLVITNDGHACIKMFIKLLLAKCTWIFGHLDPK